MLSTGRLLLHTAGLLPQQVARMRHQANRGPHYYSSNRIPLKSLQIEDRKILNYRVRQQQTNEENIPPVIDDRDEISISKYNVNKKKLKLERGLRLPNLDAATTTRALPRLPLKHRRRVSV